jgi:hypothetical protein
MGHTRMSGQSILPTVAFGCCYFAQRAAQKRINITNNARRARSAHLAHGDARTQLGAVLPRLSTALGYALGIRTPGDARQSLQKLARGICNWS